MKRLGQKEIPHIKVAVLIRSLPFPADLQISEANQKIRGEWYFSHPRGYLAYENGELTYCLDTHSYLSLHSNTLAPYWPFQAWIKPWTITTCVCKMCAMAPPSSSCLNMFGSVVSCLSVACQPSIGPSTYRDNGIMIWKGLGWIDRSQVFWMNSTHFCNKV